MPDSSPIFRQAALDRLSSPEQLDQMMQVTTPKSWLALGACCILVLTALAWGIWGNVHEKVHGCGVIIKGSGVFLCTGLAEGRVEEILVREGDLVKSNQLLARLDFPELSLRIKQAAMAHSNLVVETKYLQGIQAVERTNEE